MRPMNHVIALLLVTLAVPPTVGAADLPRVGLSADGKHFALADAKRTPFVPWGFNYLGRFDHLAEDDWATAEGWRRIERDFTEMKRLGANVVRWHLQFETFMAAPDRPKADELARLKALLDLADKAGLYLDLTGLNCFRLKRIPAWYDTLSEADRWAAQAVFWGAIAKTCAGHPAVFCYDLMNEPVIGKPGPKDHPWVGGELGGFHFVQRICNDPAGRDSKVIAEAWVKALVTAIRAHDKQTLVTVGVIPWAFVWPKAKPLFYSPEVARHLDFVSIHVYPAPNKLEQEQAALAAYDIGKPLVIEEIFPLNCTIPDLDKFIDATADRVDGWVAHFFGHTPAEHRAGAKPASAADFLEYWQKKGVEVTRPKR
jgi:hypothetical protein